MAITDTRQLRIASETEIERTSMSDHQCHALITIDDAWRSVGRQILPNDVQTLAWDA